MVASADTRSLGKSNVCMAAEHVPTLSQEAVRHAEAVLHNKYCFQATTEVLGTTKSSAASTGRSLAISCRPPKTTQAGRASADQELWFQRTLSPR